MKFLGMNFKGLASAALLALGMSSASAAMATTSTPTSGYGGSTELGDELCAAAFAGGYIAPDNPPGDNSPRTSCSYYCKRPGVVSDACGMQGQLAGDWMSVLAQLVSALTGLAPLWPGENLNTLFGANIGACLMSALENIRQIVNNPPTDWVTYINKASQALCALHGCLMMFEANNKPGPLLVYEQLLTLACNLGPAIGNIIQCQAEKAACQYEVLENWGWATFQCPWNGWGPAICKLDANGNKVPTSPGDVFAECKRMARDDYHERYCTWVGTWVCNDVSPDVTFDEDMYVNLCATKCYRQILNEQMNNGACTTPTTGTGGGTGSGTDAPCYGGYHADGTPCTSPTTGDLP